VYIALYRKKKNMSIPTGTWIIDGTHSTVGFTVRHLMISKVRGAFGAFTGTAVVADDFADTRIEGSVDVSTVSTNEENRDNHLRSADFFDVEKYPEMKFTTTYIETTKDEDEFLLHGELTIRDVTKPATFKAEFGGVTVDGYGQTKAALEANTTINRTEFGLTWNSTLETGGVLVSEEVKISIEAQAVLQN
jgi:polyisoprenoid-binding protein YceI